MFKMDFLQPSKYELVIIAIGVANLLAIIFLFKQLGLSVLQSDPYMYLLQSKQWWVKDLHLPGYAIIIWSINLLTFNLLPEILLLHLVSALTWVASLFSFITVMKILDIEQKNRIVLLILYAFFPLIGLTFAAWPIADSAVYLLINILVIACLKKNWILLTVALSFGLLVHKFVWGFCLLIALYAYFSLGFPLSLIFVAGLPLLIFLTWIAFQGEGAFWILQHDLERHFTSYSQFPIFDGIIGTILSSGAQNIFKGCLLLLIFTAELVLFIKAWLSRQWFAIAIIFPLLLLGLIVNQWLAIAILRFAKIAILAVVLLIASKNLKISSYLTNPKVIFLMLIILIGSQYSYAIYMERFFREGGTLDYKLQLESDVMKKKGLPTYDRGVENLTVKP